MKLLSIFSPIWENVKEPVFVLTAVGILIAIAVVLFVLHKKDKAFMTTKEITFCAFCLALSYTLSCIKIYEMPQGGSITLAGTLPIAIFAYFCGLKKGLFAGFAYSILKMTLNPYIVHPLQLLLEYTVAYTAVGVVGLFKKTSNYGLLIGIACFVLIRFACSFLAGVVFFYEYAPTQTATGITLYSAAYNSFILIDGIIILCSAFALSMTTLFRSITRLIGEESVATNLESDNS